MVFFIENKTIKVLAIVQNNEKGEAWFDMPKGHIERGESLMRAAHREIQEEIGLTLHVDTNFQEENRYVYTKKDPKTGKSTRISKSVTFFLAFMQSNERRQVVLSPEHKRYYFLPIDEAIEKAKFENQKELLGKAKHYITKHYILHEVN